MKCDWISAGHQSGSELHEILVEQSQSIRNHFTCNLLSPRTRTSNGRISHLLLTCHQIHRMPHVCVCVVHALCVRVRACVCVGGGGAGGGAWLRSHFSMAA